MFGNQPPATCFARNPDAQIAHVGLGIHVPLHMSPQHVHTFPPTAHTRGQEDFHIVPKQQAGITVVLALTPQAPSGKEFQ